MKRTTRPIVLLASLAALASATLGWVWFRWSYFDPDTASYLFQARLFAQGRLSAPAPPDFGFASSGAINIFHGQWYAKSAFGNALALAAGVLIGAPWLVPAIETGLTLAILFVFLERVYDRATARLASILMIVSPAVIGLGATWSSEVTSRLALAIYLLGLAAAPVGSGVSRTVVRLKADTSCTTSALMLGAGLGAALCTRPLTAVAFALPGAIFLAWRGRSARVPGARIARLLAIAAIPFIACAAGLLAFNARLTGNPLRFTQSAAEPLDTLGFGPRGEATYVADLRPAAYTPRVAVTRTLRHTIPAISFTALGWGYYRPDLFNPVGASIESAIGGLIARSPRTGDWIAITLRGSSTGTARVTLDGRRAGLAQSWGSVPIDAADGTARVRLRMAIAGAGSRAFVSTPAAGAAWRPVGDVPWTPADPLEVGPFASRVSRRDPLSISYLDFRVDGRSVDAFAGSLDRAWRWNREPFQWDVLPSGLSIVSEVHHSLHTDELQQPALLGDQAARLFQVADSHDFGDMTVDASAAWRRREPLLWLRAVPLAAVPILIAAVFFAGAREYDWLLLGCLVASLGLYACFYFDGSTMGRTPTHVRYHNEATSLAVVPLVARGAMQVVGWCRRRSSGLRIAGLLVAGALVVNTAHSFVVIGRDYQNWNDIFQQLPRLVARANLHHVVVFLPNTHVAPVGDYPFAPLDRADVVYFRLGPMPEWGLSGRPWREVYGEYFVGRRAFMYEHEELRELVVR